MNWDKVKCRFSLSKSVAYSIRMKKSTLSLSRSFIFSSVNLQNSFRRRNRNLFTLQSTQKAGVQGSPHTERTKWKITVAILHSERGLYLTSCYILYSYFTGKCSLYCLQSVKPVHAKDKGKIHSLVFKFVFRCRYILSTIWMIGPISTYYLWS